MRKFELTIVVDEERLALITDLLLGEVERISVGRIVATDHPGLGVLPARPVGAEKPYDPWRSGPARALMEAFADGQEFTSRASETVLTAANYAHTSASSTLSNMVRVGVAETTGKGRYRLLTAAQARMLAEAT